MILLWGCSSSAYLSRYFRHEGYTCEQHFLRDRHQGCSWLTRELRTCNKAPFSQDEYSHTQSYSKIPTVVHTLSALQVLTLPNRYFPLHSSEIALLLICARELAGLGHSLSLFLLITQQWQITCKCSLKILIMQAQMEAISFLFRKTL